MDRPRITVIVPCRNESDGVLPTLQSIVAQRDATGHPFHEWAELIVTDDESSDDTPKVLAAFREAHPATVVLRNEPRRGLSGSYNRAIGESRADLILSCHSDCAMVGDQYLHHIVEHFKTADIAGVTGKPATPNYRSLPFVEQLYILTHLMDVEPERPVVRPINFLEGRCDGFRKEALVSVGLYDEKTKISGEDQIMASRLTAKGWRLIQDTGLLYTLSCGSSQDTIRRLIRRQFVLAEAQSYLLLRHSFYTSRAAADTPNRARRKRLRMTQVLYPSLLVLAIIGLALVSWRASIAVLALTIVWRFLYHLILGGGRFSFGVMVRAFPVALACDWAYAAGFARGVMRSASSKQFG